MWNLLHTLALTNINVSPLPPVAATDTKIQAILTVAFSVIGAVCLLFVTVGGFRYVAAQGDPQAAARAKNTILYALVGVVVSISAVAIVTFVLGKL